MDMSAADAPVATQESTAAAISLRHKPSPEPARFEERQDLSIKSLIGSKLRNVRIANAPQK